MTYKELMVKLKKGEALTAEEMADMERESRPSEHYNEVAAKKSELATRVAELETENAQLKVDITTAGQLKDDEYAEKLRKEIGAREDLAKENAQLKEFKDSAIRTSKVRQIAETDCRTHTQARFKDPDYLDLLLSKRGVNIEDPEAVKAALVVLQAERPEQFVVEVNTGAGDGSSGDTNKQTKPAADDKHKSKAEMTADERAEFVREYGLEEYQKL